MSSGNHSTSMLFPNKQYQCQVGQMYIAAVLSLPLLAPSAALAVGFSCGMALQKNESHTSPVTHQKSHDPPQQ